MTWQTLTHGWNGLALGWTLVAVPMWVGLAQKKAAIRNWLASPLFAVGLLITALIVGSILRWLLSVEAEGAMGITLSFVCFVAVGYVGGHIVSRAGNNEAHKRGTVVGEGAAAQRLTRRLRKGTQPVLSLASIAVTAEDETKHFKLIGTTGTGKSTAIRELLEGALQRGDRAVIADPDGSYLTRYYDRNRGDIILNPFDDRSVQWDPLAEIRNPFDIEVLAAALIASGESASAREWRAYARTFVTAVIEACRQSEQPSIADLWHKLTIATSDELRPILASTPIQPFLAPESAKMFGSLRSVATSAVASLKYIQAQRATPFSVREWVRTGTGVLFIPYQADQIDALRTVIAAWLRLAIVQTLSRTEGTERPLWFVIDELDALGTIEGLKDALARLRKFGGRCVLGFQSIAQVSSTYGDGDAQTIVENCGNTLILRCSAAEHGGTARFASHLIGEREIIRTQVSRSRTWPSFFSARAGQVSRSVSQHHVTESAVLASEIEQLPDLTGLLKFASNPTWLRVNLK